jgi:hypothetical protein
MPILAAIFGYFISVGTVVIGLLMTLSAVLGEPQQPSSLQSASARPREIAITATPTALATKQADPDTEPALAAGRAAAENARRQYLYRPPRQEHASRLASRTPDFDSRYLGYVDDPQADRYRLQ